MHKCPYAYSHVLCVFNKRHSLLTLDRPMGLQLLANGCDPIGVLNIFHPLFLAIDTVNCQVQLLLPNNPRWALLFNPYLQTLLCDDATVWGLKAKTLKIFFFSDGFSIQHQKLVTDCTVEKSWWLWHFLWNTGFHQSQSVYKSFSVCFIELQKWIEKISARVLSIYLCIFFADNQFKRKKIQKAETDDSEIKPI